MPDPAQVIANGLTPQNASFNITGQALIGSTLTLGGAVNAPYTWGINARTQGLMVIPEGGVYDHGGGTLELAGTVIIMNPASGSWMRVAAGTYQLGVWGYLFVDLPPIGAARTNAVPQLGVWSDADRPYDHPDRLVLAQRGGAGAIYLAFNVPAPALNPQHTLLTMIGPNLGDVRINSNVVAATTWFDPPNRTLGFVTQYTGSRLRITYQDTLGGHGRFFAGCEWRMLVDGGEVMFFSDADQDLPNDTWHMSSAAHIAWASVAPGSHVVKVQVRGNRGAWGGGTNECLQGWNTTANFLSVEEIP
ncbi:MAG TPA: hypothetical protein VIV40_37550 [Kofleriaceae bacterium]